MDIPVIKPDTALAVAYGDDILHEQFYDGDKWKEGSLGAAGFSVSRTTSLAARYINGEPRVYAQLVDTSIHEYQHANNEWKLTYNFGAGFNDTGIVAPATGKHQLFYQSTESFIIEKIAEGSGWKDGKLKVRNDEANTPIVAVTFGDDSHRVYHLNSEHYIVESAWDAGDDDWTTNVSEKKVNSGSKLAGVTFLLDAYPNIQLYLQDQKGGKTISEYVHQYGSVWITHTGILPVK
ncbi:hypothetical protein F5B19DRAFT_497267 [Rostrohypoxylon terebratum]|nr:hypothetical protein F5B19DRAFT_497267 [Rostrohypoxylon terebratum]